MLVEYGLLDLPVLYLSRHIIRHKPDYYRLLQSVTETGRWEEWICYILEAVLQTARWTTAKIKAIRDLMIKTAERVRQEAPGIYSREIVELVFTQPYSRISNVVEMGLGHRQTASSHLKQLSNIGVLREIKAGREKLFVNPALVRLLTTDDEE
jgi:Fic family protein